MGFLTANVTYASYQTQNASVVLIELGRISTLTDVDYVIGTIRA